MTISIDPAVVTVTGSKTRALTLAVLANADRPFTGYRVAEVTGIPRSKVYAELARAERGGVVAKTPNGYRLADRALATWLCQRVRISWADDLLSDSRANRAARSKSLPTDWFDPTLFRRNPKVAARYHNFDRPPEKDEIALRNGRGLSRKRLDG